MRRRHAVRLGWPPGRGDHRQRAGLLGARPAPKTRRRRRGQRVERVDSTTAWPPRSTRRLARSTASSATCACSSGEPSKRRPRRRGRGAAPLGDLLGPDAGEHDLHGDSSSPGAHSRLAQQLVAPAPGGPPIATREPCPNGASFSASAPPGVPRREDRRQVLERGRSSAAPRPRRSRRDTHERGMALVAARRPRRALDLVARAQLAAADLRRRDVDVLARLAVGRRG